MRSRAVAVVLALLCAAPPLVRAQAADADAPAPPKKTGKKTEAESHYKRARELYQLGRYREAIAQLEAALQLDPNGAELLYNLALVHEKLGDVDEAIDAYKRYLAAMGPDGDPEERKKIEGVVRRLEGAKEELKAREAKKMEHRFTPLSTGLAIGGGVALAAAAVFGAFALRDDKQARDFVVGSGGASGDRDAMIDKSRKEAVFADVLGAVGVAAAGAAITLYFTSEFPREDDAVTPQPASGPAARVSVGPIARGGATMRLEVVF